MKRGMTAEEADDFISEHGCHATPMEVYNREIDEREERARPVRALADLAYDSIRAGAPGLSDATCRVIAGSIARKAEAELTLGQLQFRVSAWLIECFGVAIASDRLERGDRLLEEVLELLQSGDYPAERVAALVGYVWGRPRGEPVQEVGGVGVTLLAYCAAHGIHAGSAVKAEVDRVTQPAIMEKIRAKQAAKPTGSALPVGPKGETT